MSVVSQEKRQFMTLMRKIFICLFVFLSIMQVHLVSQAAFKPRQTEQAPVIDGKLNDPVWTKSPSVSGFKTFVPDFGKEMSEKTMVYLAYDRENLYFAFRCFDKQPEKIKASVSNRDNIGADDWICINLDSFNDQQSLYGLYVNPLGIQGDTRYAGGKEDRGFDTVWYSAGQIDSQGYTIEVQIPLKSIRFNHKKETTMGVIFERKVSRRNEQGTFPALSPKQSEAFLTQMMPMVFHNLKRYTLLEVLPSFTFHQTHSREEGELKRDKSETKPSLTLKYGLTSQLVLDGTINPDFSQIEADAGQVDVNLRYQLFYPEKRPFFLEGREYFNLAGNPLSNSVQSVVHTRTIADPVMGLKLSGKFGRRNTLAAIYARDRVPDIDEDAAFTIFRYKRSLKGDSYLGGVYTSRILGDFSNSLAGIDGHIRTGRSDTIDFHGLYSFASNGDIPGREDGHALSASFTRLTRNWTMLAGLNDLSENFRVDTGYITRTGITRFTGLLGPKFYPTWPWLRRIDGELFLSLTKDKESGLWETFNHISFLQFLKGATIFKIKYAISNEIFMQQRFQTGGLSILINSQIHKKLFFSILYRRRQAIYYSDNPLQGYENRIQSELLFQPSEKLKTELSFIYFDLYRDSDGEKIFDYPIFRFKQVFQFNKYLFFRGILEYNDYHKELLTDLLVSFTYIPGTVIHMGYGSLYNRQQWQHDRFIDVNRFIENKRGFFFKASYLWRL